MQNSYVNLCARESSAVHLKFPRDIFLYFAATREVFFFSLSFLIILQKYMYIVHAFHFYLYCRRKITQNFIHNFLFFIFSVFREF